MLRIDFLVPLLQVPYVTQNGIDAEKLPHHNQAVDRQSHTTTEISTFLMIPMQLWYVKKGNKHMYPVKFNCKLQLCATATTSNRECSNNVNVILLIFIFFYVMENSDIYIMRTTNILREVKKSLVQKVALLQ